MAEAVSKESFVDRLGLWGGGWALSVALWWPIQIVFHPGKILGDGGLGALFVLVCFFGWVFFIFFGVMTYREAAKENAPGTVRFSAAKVIGLGVVAWLLEGQVLVAVNNVGNGVALVASLLMPFAFVAASLIVTGRDRNQRTGWLTLLALAIALACLRIA